MILVTGAAGFIGSNLAAALNESGRRDLILCDRLRGGDKWKNIRGRDFDDLITPEDLAGWLERKGQRLSAVLHMGAISSTTVTDGDAVVRENLRFSLDLLEFCTAAGVPLVYASSAATYGDGARGFDDDLEPEALARLVPLNLYAFSKHAFDRIVCRRAKRGERLPPQWVGLKFFNVFGPNEFHKGAMQSVLTKLWPDIAAGRAVKLFKSAHPDYPDGGQMRDFVYVGDVERVVLWLLDNPAVSGLFNVGTGKARSFADFLGAGFAAAGREPDIVYVDMPEAIRDKYQYFTEARTERLRAAGYPHAARPLEEAVAEYVGRYLGRQNPYR
jgi:ADP-L-glycero-D-manno-heptose 6-epimerase